MVCYSHRGYVVSAALSLTASLPFAPVSSEGRFS
jgi:hypothetical protein